MAVGWVGATIINLPRSLIVESQRESVGCCLAQVGFYLTQPGRGGHSNIQR